MEPAVGSLAARKTVRFGLFEADLSAGELRKRGRAVKLQDQPFQVLRCCCGGRWLLYTQYAGQGRDLMLVENFR